MIENHRKDKIMSNASTTRDPKMSKTARQIKEELSILSVGDRLLVPVSALREANGRPVGSKVEAEIIQICSYHIVFQLDSGVKFSMLNAQCCGLPIVSQKRK